ncbi:hypothetical protein BJY04DRAFT_223628 [Aspergillus karnatakaensis]|uniref:dihydrodipicolinate synthase family protein n=1 Tax=Aspergillus karnatakaensis TaxID=1810916 RepID=UPI003CCDF644
MGEAVHLSRTERVGLIEAARSALNEIHLDEVPVVAGAGAPSTRESIDLCREAAAAGADYVMVIPPGYYAGALQSDSTAIRNFFVDIAKASPVPVIVYNFPAVAGGLDMDSDQILEIVKGSSNICGVELTCANVGKLTRIMAAVTAPGFEKQYPRRFELPFRAIDGFIDFLLPSVSVGAAGAISGLPNIVPKSCVKLWELCQDKEQATEAQHLQNMISQADGIALKIGIAGMKKLLSRKFGYGERPRLPLLPMSDVAVDKVLENPYWKDLLEMEQRL